VGTAYGALRLKCLQGLVQDWNEKLAPIEDPLTARFGLNRWLEADREEAYSDWLAWSLLEFRSITFVWRLLFGKNQTDDDWPYESSDYKVDREVWVPEGHKGRAGRLDCVLQCDDVIIVLELKRSFAEDADTAKHEGYLKWLSNQPQRVKIGILIANSSEGQEFYDGFSLLEWRTLCKRGRRLAGEMRAQNRLAFIATFCAFIGAIEQNLLGFPYVGDIRTHHQMNGEDLDRVITYLLEDEKGDVQ
jgi:hypothetical protein